MNSELELRIRSRTEMLLSCLSYKPNLLSLQVRGLACTATTLTLNTARYYIINLKLLFNTPVPSHQDFNKQSLN